MHICSWFLTMNEDVYPSNTNRNDSDLLLSLFNLPFPILPLSPLNLPFNAIPLRLMHFLRPFIDMCRLLRVREPNRPITWRRAGACPMVPMARNSLLVVHYRLLMIRVQLCVHGCRIGREAGLSLMLMLRARLDRRGWGGPPQRRLQALRKRPDRFVVLTRSYYSARFLKHAGKRKKGGFNPPLDNIRNRLHPSFSCRPGF